ncbi:DUF459 domain-containing protein [Solidesulfovibrio sp.]
MSATSPANCPPRPVAAAARQAGAGSRQPRRPGRFLAATALACGLCLGVAACSQDTPEKTTSSAAPPATGTAPAAKAAPADPQTKRARRILVVGDSLSISLGEQLEHVFSGTPGIDMSRDGQRSTGLSRPELLDWPARLQELAAAAAPDVAVIMLGANDAMPMTAPDGSRTYFENPAWAEVYAAKARELVEICRRANPAAAVYWVGVPAMGEASLAAGVKQINAALAAMCATAGCQFIATEAAFSDPEGRFARHARDAATGDAVPLRTADGVHLTETGSKLLAGVVLRVLADREQLPPLAGLEELRLLARDLRPIPDDSRPQNRDTPVKPQKTVRPGKKTYAVRSGDTFLTIAKRLGIDPGDLAAVNPGVDSRRLSIGQTLRLPAKR